MRLILYPTLFVRANDLALEGLLHRALEQRCYLSVMDPEHADYTAWKNRQSRRNLDAWQAQLDWTTREQAVHRISSIRVEERIDADWTSTPIRLSIADAVELVATPYRVYLENARFDRAFFSAMLEPQHRDFVDWLEKKNFLIFVNGGGIGELRKNLVNDVSGNRFRIVKSWALFDSDAAAPGVVSREAQALSDVCRGLGVAFTCLRRRAIENYLPKGALYDFVWAGTGRQRSARKTIVDAFCSLASAQREHFHMKSGWSSAPTEAENALYAGVAPEVRVALCNGIADGVAEQYQKVDRYRLRSLIEKEGAHLEMQVPLETLLQKLRVPNG